MDIVFIVDDMWPDLRPINAFCSLSMICVMADMVIFVNYLLIGYIYGLFKNVNFLIYVAIC